MGNYIYNGIELRALPEWDRETYPYAAIWRVSTTGSYTLFCMSEPFVYGFHEKNGTGCYSDGSGISAGCVCRTEIRDWSSFEECSDIWRSSMHWSNHDILNEDGTLYLAASDPVPVTQLNPAALMQSFFVGQAVRRMRKKQEVTRWNYQDFSHYKNVWVNGGYVKQIVYSPGSLPYVFEASGNDDSLVATYYDLLLPQTIEAGKHIEMTYYFPTVTITTAASVGNTEFEILPYGDENGCWIHCMGKPTDEYLGASRVMATSSPFVDENPAMGWVYENGEIVGMKVSGNLRVPMSTFNLRSIVYFNSDGQKHDWTLKEEFTRENPFIMVVK